MMEQDTFGAGIRPGGLTDMSDIKVTIAYLLVQLRDPTPESLIGECFTMTQMVNYFDYQIALSELIALGQVEVAGSDDGDRLLRITDTGRYATQELQSSVPLSVRDRTLEAIQQLIERRRNEQHNKVTIEKADDGYIVHIRMLDLGSDLMSLSLFVPDRETADRVRARFLRDPAGVYVQILSLLAEGSPKKETPLLHPSELKRKRRHLPE